MWMCLGGNAKIGRWELIVMLRTMEILWYYLALGSRGLFNCFGEIASYNCVMFAMDRRQTLESTGPGQQTKQM
jgi:hypothetical protein